MDGDWWRLSPVCSLLSQQPLHWSGLQHDLQAHQHHGYLRAAPRVRGHRRNGKLHHQLHHGRGRRKLTKAHGKEPQVLSNQFQFLLLHYFPCFIIISSFYHSEKFRGFKTKLTLEASQNQAAPVWSSQNTDYWVETGPFPNEALTCGSK